MSLLLYAHPFSSYCWKVLISLYENETPFEFRMVSPDHPAETEELAKLWPLAKFPVLSDNGKPVIEASIIIEHLMLNHPAPVRLIPSDPKAALDVRFMDRFFDNYIMTPMVTIVFNAIREEKDRDPFGVTQAKASLEKAYAWLENHMHGREWAAGDAFSLADCAASPALFYADWTHPIAESFPNIRAYRKRLLARPTMRRIVEEARPYRDFFPLGAPDRD